jgi:hypothetical protein
MQRHFVFTSVARLGASGRVNDWYSSLWNLFVNKTEHEKTIAWRMASIIDTDGPAAQSVPSPTVTPAFCGLRTLHAPEYNWKLDEGQCTMKPLSEREAAVQRR